MNQLAFAVHAHFYQPPREDPLTGEIPQEPGAMPYRNWNERIHDHCYRPNAIQGNFERISFNIGPTLMDWMADYDIRTVERIIEQDRWNLERNGMGNAMAQPYHHTILPLASTEDKITQIRWGLADFQHRFGHSPTGMWLPETAVDDETLQIMAENGIEYTILAPWQAQSSMLDVSQPYSVTLSNGKSFAVFFYDQDLSTLISFDPSATVNADQFIKDHLFPRFAINGKDAAQLILVASDGELYGHHQPFRDKFLTYLMGGAISNHPIEPTYPALWLKQHPPLKNILVRPFTSWSCHHGVTRWMGVCGCTSHGEWKAPLRQAMREIALLIDEQYLKALDKVVPDPWELRHQYIHVILHNLTLRELIASLAIPMPDDIHLKQIGLLLAAQYERQRMFTSCGWFFDDFDRIEPRNNVSYLAQAVLLTYQATGVDLSMKASIWLKPVKSWRSGVRADLIFNNHLQRGKERLQQRFPDTLLELSQ